jgi:alpha/beta superfamily hydrolase
VYPKGNLLIPASHGHLEAILKESSGERRGVGLVCHPHPMGGGTMHNKVVFRIASGLLDAGLAAMRFNFRGVGASTGAHAEVDGGKDDVRDALAYLKGRYPDDEITLAGFSFGSRTGMEIGMADDRVVRLISVGTPVDKYHDYDFLTRVNKPILFVHGDRDEFGSVYNLRSLTDRIPHADVLVLKNCGHFFEGHLDDLRNTIRDWVSSAVG